MRAWIAAALLSAAAPAAQIDPPSKGEIAGAYRSKCGEHVFLPGIRRETWCVKNIRGWSLKFKRTGEERLISVIVRRYHAVARKDDTCAEYRIEERIVLPPPNPQIGLRPGLTVEPEGVRNCR